jgi:hypothetical protein
VFEAHRLLYHSTLGSRVIKKKKKFVARVKGRRGWATPNRLARHPATYTPNHTPSTVDRKASQLYLTQCINQTVLENQAPRKIVNLLPTITD